jgi:hypothetical protein
LHNIEKCINAGYETVVACSKDKKTFEKICKQVETKLNKEAQNKVHIFGPDSLFLFLDQQLAREASTEERIKGYRVKVSYNAVSESEAKAKQDSILRVIVDAERRKSQGKE